MKDRIEILSELEEKLSYPVAAIIYRDNEEIREGDQSRVYNFFSDFNTESLALILHGDGGHVPTSGRIAMTLKHKFKKNLITYVPEKAASSTSLTWLISNKAYFCSQTVATQMNMCYNCNNDWDSDKGWIAPKGSLKHDNEKIAEASKKYFHCDYKILEIILKRKDALLGGKLPKDPRIRDEFLENVFEKTHKREDHSYPPTVTMLRDWGFNVELPQKNISDLLCEYLRLAKKEQKRHKKSRYIYETNRQLVMGWGDREDDYRTPVEFI